MSSTDFLGREPVEGEQPQTVTDFAIAQGRLDADGNDVPAGEQDQQDAQEKDQQDQ
jgi:hypothetical protein